MELHVLNSTGVFNEHMKLINDTFDRSINLISELIPIDKADVVVECSKKVIPETGIGGFSPSAHTVYMTIDLENENLSRNFKVEFLATLAHELHHCMRCRGPGYGNTLKDTIVTEGLACHFETELRNGTIPFYASCLDAQRCKTLLSDMKPDMNINNYDHNSWFFGSEAKQIPRHAGYAVGFYVVHKYIAKSGIPASQLWLKPTSEFLS